LREESATSIRRPWPLLFPILWMAVVFLLSGNLLSSSNTEKLVIPFLHTFFPYASWKALAEIHLFLRKGWHVLEYALLTYFWALALGPYWRRERRLHLYLFIALLGLGYALFDEFHQSFCPSRGSSFADVLVDVAGVLSIFLILWLRQQRPERQAH
jgi:VanZ family protein